MDHANNSAPDLGLIPSQQKDRLQLFNNLVQRSFQQDEEENRQFADYHKYTFDNALTDMDIKALRLDNRSTLNYPILKPYLLRSLKNVIDSSPTLDIVAIDPEGHDEQTQLPFTTISEILNEKIREILEENHWDHVLFQVAQHAWVGGKGIFKIRTDYKNSHNFDQKYVIESVEDPTTVVFDTRARSITKEDGEFAAELCPMTKEDFEAYYPDIPWSEIEGQGRWIQTPNSRNRLNWYKNDNQTKIAVVCDMYYKQYESVRIYQLNNGQIIDRKLKKEEKDMGLEVIQSRKIMKTRIYHTRFCGDIEIEAPQLTNFNKLPLIRCPGEIIYQKGKELLMPYIQHALDAQRTKNFLMNFFLNEALNHDRGKWIVAEESMNDQDILNLRRPMDNFVLRYKQYGQSDVSGNEMVQHAPPVYVQPAQMPTQYLEAFSMLDGTIEKILGNQFPSMNEVDLSGKALYNMADFMSSSNEIFMQHLIVSLTCLGQLILDSMPYVLSPEKIGLVPQNEDPKKLNSPVENTVLYNFDFQEGDFTAKITRGVNYKLQQQRNVEMLLEFAKMYPPLSQFLFTDGFQFMISNMDFNDKQSLTDAYQRYQQKMEQAKMNPQAQQMQQMMMQEKQQELKNQELNAQAHMIKAQTDQHKLALEGAKLQHSQHETASDHAIELSKLATDLSKNRLDNLTKLLHIKSTDVNEARRMQHGQYH